MFKSLRARVIAAAVVIAVATAGLFAYGFHVGNDGASGTANAASQNDAEAKLRVVLDPRKFNGDVRKAYEAAQNNPELFVQLHCYCGCDHDLGHQSLLDCFRDKHGSNCEICMGEALEAERLAKQGMPVEQIRDSLRARFAPSGS